MSASTTRQIGGVLLKPDATPFANSSLTIYRDKREVVPQGDAAIVDEVLRTVTGPGGEVSMALVPGKYLGQIRLSDADRYFQFAVPDGAGPFVIADLIETSPISGAQYLTLLDLVTTARAWAEKPEDEEVVENGYSALHWAAKAEGARAGAKEWAQSPDPISPASGGNGTTDRSAKFWAEQSEEIALPDGSIAGSKLSQRLAVRLGTLFDTVQDMLASTIPPQGVGSRWSAGGFDYEEAAPDATDAHVETAGGVKLKVLPTSGEYDARAFGVMVDGSGDQSERAQAWLNAAAGAVAVWDGVISYGTRLDLSGSQFSNTTLRGNGRTSALRPIWQGNDQMPDALRVQNCDNITLKDFLLDGSSWPDAVPFEERAHNEWARVGFFNVNGLRINGLSGQHLASVFRLTDVRNYTIDDIQCDDTGAVVAFFDGSKTGILSNIHSTRQWEDVIDWGGGGGSETIATNIHGSAEGSWKTNSDEGLDLGGADNVLVSNSSFTGFFRGASIKGEGAVWGTITLSNIQFLDVVDRGLIAIVGDQTNVPVEDFGTLTVTGCTFKHAADRAEPELTPESRRSFIRIDAGNHITFTNNTVYNDEPEYWALYLHSSASSMTIKGNRIVSAGGGIKTSSLSVNRFGEHYDISGNIIHWSTLSGIDVMGFDTCKIADNSLIYIAETPTNVPGVRINGIKEIDVSQNLIDGCGGHGIYVTIQPSITRAEQTVTLIGTPPFVKLCIEGNRVRNWGLATSTRSPVLLQLVSVSGSLYGGKIAHNQAYVDDDSANSQIGFGVSGATTDQLERWVFSGNQCNFNPSGSSAFNANSEVNNLFFSLSGT